MKIRSMMRAACALGLALAIPSQGALATDDDAWVRTAAPNGAISVETPCLEAEIAALRSIPDKAFEGINFVPGSRIICRKGPLLFVAGVAEVKEFPAGASSLFDSFAEGVAKERTADGKPTMTTVAGRRAIVNREEKDGRLAQSGLVEMSPTTVIFLIGGAEDTSLSVAAQGQALDRFYASLKVTGQ